MPHICEQQGAFYVFSPIDLQVLYNFPALFYECLFQLSLNNALTHLFFLPSEQLIIYQVGVLPSHFYNVLSDKDYSSFRNLMGKAVVLIILNSTVSSCSQKLIYLLTRYNTKQYSER